MALHSTYAIVTEPLRNFAGWPHQADEKWLMWETAWPYLYIRSTPDGRAIIGGEDIIFKNDIARDKLISRKAGVLIQRFNELFSDIHAETAFAWAGTFGATEEFPHADFALGCGGNGITFSIIAAQILRDACLGNENTSARLFRFNRWREYSARDSASAIYRGGSGRL